MPRVSFTIACRNEAAGIGACLESLRRQTFEDWEAIVVDDGSIDNSPELVERFAAEEPRVRLLRQPQRGVSAARNKALASARGELIAVQDASDLSMPDRLSIQVAFLDAHPDMGVISAQYGWFGRNPELARVVLRFPTDEQGIATWFYHYRRMAVPHGPSLIRRDFLAASGGYDETLPRAEDLHLYLRLHALCRMATLPQTLYLYQRLHRMTLRSYLFNRRCHRYAYACRQPDVPDMGWFAEYCRRHETAPVGMVIHTVSDALRYIKYRIQLASLNPLTSSSPSTDTCAS